MNKSKIIDGKLYAAQLRSSIGQKVAVLKQKHGITPGIAVILVGEDPASRVYVKNKGKAIEKAGMNSFSYQMPADTSQTALLATIKELNDNPEVHGILVQLPLPNQIDESAVIQMVDPKKDVDGFHVINVGRLSVGADGLVPCTPLGCIMLLKDTIGELTGKHALVLGRSNIVGKPMAQLLLREHCTVTIAHSRTRDLAGQCRRADILVAAVGRPQMVRGDWIKPGAVVIDVGINRVPAGEEGETRLVGDVHFDEAVAVVSAITPVPGGVGPMTIACLLQNTLTAVCKQSGVEVPDGVAYLR